MINALVVVVVDLILVVVVVAPPPPPPPPAVVVVLVFALTLQNIHFIHLFISEIFSTTSKIAKKAGSHDNEYVMHTYSPFISLFCDTCLLNNCLLLFYILHICPKLWCVNIRVLFRSLYNCIFQFKRT